MFDVLIYLGHSALCLAALYIIYKAAMSNETMHRLNRVVLLGIVALSALLPLCEIKIKEEVEVELVEYNNFYLPDEQAISTAEMVVTEIEPFDYLGLLKSAAIGLFLLGVVFMLVRLAMSVFSVWRMIQSGRVEYLKDDVTLTVVDNLPSPFSYFGHIVVAESDLKENRDLILAHELAHIRLRHSWDVLFVDLALCVWWFNPAMWLLRRELQSLHEYQADKAVLDSGVDAKTYQLLLIKRAVGARLHSIANCLNHSNLKNRITMMCKKSSSRWAAAKLLLVLPLVVLSLAATATTVYVTVDNIDESKVKQNSQNNQTSVRFEERPFDTEVVKDDKFALSPAGSERYNLVPTEANVAIQQSEKREIKGKIVDEQGKPIGNVFVLVKNSNMGSITDSDGQFAGLEVIDDDILEISHVGYESQQVAVKGKSSFNITLKTRIYTTETDAEVSSESAVLKAEVMPKFMGGDLNKFRNWVQMHIKYPKVAQEQVIQGRVIAEFIIEKDGKLTFSKIMESPHESLSAEVEGAIRLSPNWTPGANGGKPVRVKMHIPVNFAIRNGGPVNNAEQPAKRSVSGNAIDEDIATLIVISNNEFLYNGIKVNQVELLKHLENYNCETINVQCYKTASLNYIGFLLGKVVDKANIEFIDPPTERSNENQPYTSIIRFFHDYLGRIIRNDECAVGVVYADIEVGRTGLMTIKSITAPNKSSEVSSYLIKKVETALKRVIVSIPEKIDEPQSIRLEIVFAKRENGELFMPDVQLGKDPFTIIGGEPLSVAENKAASSSKEKVVAGFSDSKPAPASSNNDDDEDQPLMKAEVMPKFMGGDLNKFRNWMLMHMKYLIVVGPEQEVIPGRVIAEFVVEKDGKVSFSKIIESPHELLSAEVEDAIRHSPNWTPGMNGGKPVRVKMHISVNFGIRNDGPVDNAKRGNDEDQPLMKAEILPSFQGGSLDDYQHWVESQIEYPKKLREKGIGGRVTVEFVVEKDGSVTFSKILQSPHELFSAEVERVMKSSPKWSPGKQRGEPVTVKMQMRVNFQVNEFLPTQVKGITKYGYDEPLEKAEKMPSFMGGGMDKFTAWAQSKLEFPRSARIADIDKGKIIATFIVEKDGSVSSAGVMSTLPNGKAFADEALRVIELSPKWEPGSNNGNPVRVKCSVTFKFAEYKRKLMATVVNH